MNRPVCKGMCGMRTNAPPPPPPPRSQKGSACWDCKIIKMIQNNVVMVDLTVSMHLQQLEDLKFHIFPGSMPRTTITLKSSELAWSIIPTLIIWSWFWGYFPPPPPRKILATDLMKYRCCCCFCCCCFF